MLEMLLAKHQWIFLVSSLSRQGFQCFEGLLTYTLGQLHAVNCLQLHSSCGRERPRAPAHLFAALSLQVLLNGHQAYTKEGWLKLH
jgi:hypothetical protein